MRLLTALSLLLASVAITSAHEELNSPCNKRGEYVCTTKLDAVAICDAGKWSLAAKCGKEGCCVWPDGDLSPSCMC